MTALLVALGITALSAVSITIAKRLHSRYCPCSWGQ